jgi:hypothetical protein
VEVHVLPRGFDPVAIGVFRLMMRDKKVTYALIIFGVDVVSKRDGHVRFLFRSRSFGISIKSHSVAFHPGFRNSIIFSILVKYGIHFEHVLSILV